MFSGSLIVLIIARNLIEENKKLGSGSVTLKLTVVRTTSYQLLTSYHITSLFGAWASTEGIIPIQAILMCRS